MYIIKEDTLIFAPEFNGLLDIKFVLNYKNVIFSDYRLEESIFEAYENDKFINFIYQGSKFNREVNFLQQFTEFAEFTEFTEFTELILLLEFTEVIEFISLSES